MEDFIIDEWLDTKIKASENELRKERDCVGHLVSLQSSCNADLHFKHARLWDLRWHIKIYAHWDCTKCPFAQVPGGKFAACEITTDTMLPGEN